MQYWHAYAIIASDNGLSPVRRQAIIQTNAGLLLTELLGKNEWNFNRNSNIFIQENTIEKKMSSAKWRPFCQLQSVCKYGRYTELNDGKISEVLLISIPWMDTNFAPSWWMLVGVESFQIKYYSRPFAIRSAPLQPFFYILWYMQKRVSDKTRVAVTAINQWYIHFTIRIFTHSRYIFWKQFLYQRTNTGIK